LETNTIYLVTSKLAFLKASKKKQFISFISGSPKEANTLLHAHVQLEFGTEAGSFGVGSADEADGNLPVLSTTMEPAKISTTAEPEWWEKIEYEEMENIQAMGAGVGAMFLICICYYCMCCRKSSNVGGKELEDEEEYMAADPDDYRESNIELQPTKLSEEKATATAFASFNSLSSDEELVPVGTYGNNGGGTMGGDSREGDFGTGSSGSVNKRLPNDLQRYTVEAAFPQTDQHQRRASGRSAGIPGVSLVDPPQSAPVATPIRSGSSELLTIEQYAAINVDIDAVADSSASAGPPERITLDQTVGVDSARSINTAEIEGMWSPSAASSKESFPNSDDHQDNATGFE